MAIRNRALLIAAVLLITMSLAACGHYTCHTTFGSGTCSSGGGGIGTGGGGGNTQSIAIAYFLDFTGQGMTEQQLGLGTGGTFVDMTAFVPPVLPVSPTAMIIVNKKYLYVTSSTGLVYAFSIDSKTGDLTLVTQTPYTVVGGNSMTSDPAGQYVFVGDQSGDRISVFSVNATDGTLTAVSGSPFAATISPAVLTTDGQSKYLYASNAAGLVAGFSIGGTGGLTSVGNPFSFSFSSMAGEKTGKYLVGVSGLGDTTVHVLGIGTGGVLADVSGSPFTTLYPPFAVSMHPNGTWFYTFNGDTFGALDPIEGYSLGTGGALTTIVGSPFNLSSAGGPIEQSGLFMFGLGQTIGSGTTDSTVTPYNINSSTGALTDSLGPQGYPGTDTALYVVTDAQ